MYARKRDLMLQTIKETFPKEVKWTIPSGGLFLWVTMPRSINTRVMLSKALEKKVAYIVGDAFYPDGSQYNSMRLNFSYSKDEDIVEGVRRLSEVIKEEIALSMEETTVLGNGI
jgi:DNA-binding transcriptional MocR family regulator